MMPGIGVQHRSESAFTFGRNRRSRWPGIRTRVKDAVVLGLARSESRVLLTEDKDFGWLAYAGGQQTAGVLLIRFPGDARNHLREAVSSVVTELGQRLTGAFVVIEPGRARVSRPPASG
jgi:predicted nuclease of predicted toxin-antitoxin system